MVAEPPAQAPVGTSAERVMDTLRKRILDGEIPPGSAIMQDAIAGEFGVSRIPVRDALSGLAAEGLVAISPNRPARARLLNRRGLGETYEIRQQLEALAIAKSAAAITPEQMQIIERQRQLAEDARHDPKASLIEDEVFHLACYGTADSPQLLEMIERLWRITRVYRIANWSRLEEWEKDHSFEEHRMIVSALKHRRSALASELIKVHLQTTLERLMGSPYLFETELAGGNERNSL